MMPYYEDDRAALCHADVMVTDHSNRRSYGIIDDESGPVRVLEALPGPNPQTLIRSVRAMRKHTKNTVPNSLFPLEAIEVDRPVEERAEVSDLAAGTAAEHLVCADLLMQGHGAYLTDQNTAYDVVADVGGSLIRVQVKATREQKAIPQRVAHVPSYMWHVRRRGRGGARVYGDNEYDILALVALDCKRIAYMPPEMKLQTIHIRPEGTSGGKQFDDYPFSKAIEGIVR